MSRVHTYEKAFLTLGAILLVVCLAVLTYSSAMMGIHLPDDVGITIDPTQVLSTPPFDNVGVHPVGDNEYDVVFIGQVWLFRPNEITVPVGAKLNFIGTSADVLHGFNIEGTRVNMMLIPGQISKNTYTFDEPGEHLILCHEYCGVGHHTMFGRIIVE